MDLGSSVEDSSTNYLPAEYLIKKTPKVQSSEDSVVFTNGTWP